MPQIEPEWVPNLEEREIILQTAQSVAGSGKKPIILDLTAELDKKDLWGRLGEFSPKFPLKWLPEASRNVIGVDFTQETQWLTPIGTEFTTVNPDTIISYNPGRNYVRIARWATTIKGYSREIDATIQIRKDTQS